MDKKINFNNLELFSDREIADFLYQKIEEEFQKDEKDIDCDFLNECSLLLYQIQGKENICESEEKLKEIWNKIISKYQSSKTNSSERNFPRKRISFKKLFIIAAAIMLLSTVAVSTVVADTPFHFVNMLFLEKHIDDISEGETISKGNITVTRADRTTKYETLEELLKEEEISGIYFSESLDISNLSISEHEGKLNLRITPTEQDVCFAIDITQKDKYGLQYEVPTYTKTTTENGIDVWEYDKGENEVQTGRYQLMFKINDWYYCFYTSSPEKGYELIDTFKEITP